MKKSKRCKHEDRLSALPNSVIFKIFWLLPMTDVVTTTLLSKRWRNLWTFSPFLNFDNDAMRLEDGELQKFVNRALLCWNGDRVLKFKFDSFEQLDCATHSDIDLWVSFAQRNGVEELDLHVQSFTTTRWKDEVYWVPQCLSSCSSLKELTLKDCSFSVFGNVQWNQLERLRIECFRISAHVVNQILSGSPQLRIFILKFAERDGISSIQVWSSSLKELSIHKYLLDGLSVDAVLRICTPNLETLEIKGIPFSKCLLINVSSLTSATIALCGLQHCKLKHDSSPGKDFQANTLSQILPAIQHVEKVALFDCCIQVLGVMKMKCMNSSFPNVKSLGLRCCFNEYKQLVALLEIFPQMERLVLVDNIGDGDQDDRESLKFEPNLHKSFLLQLRTVEVTWTNDESMFPLIEFLLKYASKLERMVLRVKLKWSPTRLQISNSLLLVSQKLLRMPRSSPTCTIDVYKHRNAHRSW